MPVTVCAVQSSDANVVEPGYHRDDWDLYPVPLYDTWLPATQETCFGRGLQAPVYTLVDSRGAVVSHTYSFPNVGRAVQAE